jgi:hypothetical protein
MLARTQSASPSFIRAVQQCFGNFGAFGFHDVEMIFNSMI